MCSRKREQKKGINGARSHKKNPIEFDHLHENDISFWGKWHGANMLCGILLRVDHNERSGTRTIKKVEYLERQSNGTYFNVDNNTRSRDLAHAAANQAFISHAISERRGQGRGHSSGEQSEYKRQKTRHSLRTYEVNLYQPVLISSRISATKCWDFARVSSITPGVFVAPKITVKIIKNSKLSPKHHYALWNQAKEYEILESHNILPYDGHKPSDHIEDEQNYHIALQNMHSPSSSAERSFECPQSMQPGQNWLNPGSRFGGPGIGGASIIEEPPYNGRTPKQRFDELVSSKRDFLRDNGYTTKEECENEYDKLLITLHSTQGQMGSLGQQKELLLNLHNLRTKPNVLSICGGQTPEIDALKRLGVGVREVMVVDVAIDAIGVGAHRNHDVRYNIMVYKNTIGGNDSGDITRLSQPHIRKIIVACGGFDVIIITSPCKDFSLAGQCEGVLGKSGAILLKAGRVMSWVLQMCPFALYCQEEVKSTKENEIRMQTEFPLTPVLVDNAWLGYSLRKRMISTDIPIDICPTDYHKKNLQDILDSGWETNHKKCLCVKASNGSPTQVFKKRNPHCMRSLNCNELERSLDHEDNATKYTIEKEIKGMIKKCQMVDEQSGHVEIVPIHELGYSLKKPPAIVPTKRRVEMLGDSVSVGMFKYILHNLRKLFILPPTAQ